jgi:hypothetical protein
MMRSISKIGLIGAFCVGVGLTWGLTRASVPSEQAASIAERPKKSPSEQLAWPNPDFSGIEMGDRLYGLFNTYEPKLPFVKTVTYTARAPFAKGRSAWLSDYATHFKTSKHFIACSLNRAPHYELQRVREGDIFNVLDADLDIRFHLVVDLSRSHMWLYFVDLEKDEHLLLKNFPVSLGRLESHAASRSLTPLGTYTLGERIGIYKPGKIGHYNGGVHEMIRTFGTRWIPFEKEVVHCTAPARGFGIHGCPWREGEEGSLVEDRSVLGTYQTDGCIQLVQEDMEKLFSIIITRPTTIEITTDIKTVTLPGKRAESDVPLR